jgi:hypothetical protein
VVQVSAPTNVPSIETHPDIVELRARYERASVTPFGQGIEALAIVVGLYLAVSPWVAGFNGFPTLAINNLVTGIAYAVLIGGFGPAFERSHARGWAACLIGVWSIVAPWVVSGSVATTRTIVSNVVVGALALCLALAMCGLARVSARRPAMAGDEAGRPAAGWSRRSATTGGRPGYAAEPPPDKGPDALGGGTDTGRGQRGQRGQGGPQYPR